MVQISANPASHLFHFKAFGASNEALEKTVADEMGTCLARCLARPFNDGHLVCIW